MLFLATMEKPTVKIPWDCRIPLHATTINTRSILQKTGFPVSVMQVHYLLHAFALLHCSFSSKSTRPFPGKTSLPIFSLLTSNRIYHSTHDIYFIIKARKIKPGRERSNSRLTSLQVEELIDRPFFPSFLNKQQQVLQACRFDHVEKSFRKLI